MYSTAHGGTTRVWCLYHHFILVIVTESGYYVFRIGCVIQCNLIARANTFGFLDLAFVTLMEQIRVVPKYMTLLPRPKSSYWISAVVITRDSGPIIHLTTGEALLHSSAFEPQWPGTRNKGPAGFDRRLPPASQLNCCRPLDATKSAFGQTPRTQSLRIAVLGALSAPRLLSFVYSFARSVLQHVVF